MKKTLVKTFFALAFLSGVASTLPPAFSRAPQDSIEKTEEQAKKEAERKEAIEKKQREANRKKGDLTFDDLKFEIERDGNFEPSMLTDDIKQFDKKTIKIRGFMLPTSVFQQTGIKQFVLVRDNQECCFGPGAMLYDCIFVEMDSGKTTTFTNRVVTIKGKFEIDTESEALRTPEGKHLGIYKMKVSEIK